jgi:hypothetical protein
MHIRRLLRRAGFARSPLRRRVDRAELIAALVAALLVIAMLPVALALGRSAHHAGLAQSAAEQSARHAVEATLLVGVPAPVGSSDMATPLATPAVWRTSDGVRHAGLAPAWPGTPAGVQVPIWVDRSGALVNPPLTVGQAFWRGVLTTLLVILATIAWCAVLLAGLHWWSNRRRYARWDREWRQVGPLWTQYRS